MNEFGIIPWVANGPVVYLPPDLRLAMIQDVKEGSWSAVCLLAEARRTKQFSSQCHVSGVYACSQEGPGNLHNRSFEVSPAMFHYGFP
jgi:hypothetical protein